MGVWQEHRPELREETLCSRGSGVAPGPVPQHLLLQRRHRTWKLYF